MWRVGMIWTLAVALLLGACLSVDERRRATLERAEKLLALGDSLRALQVLNGFLSYDPRDLEIIARMAEIHLELGSPKTAIHVLDSIPGDVDLDARSTELLARALVGGKDIARATRLLIRLEAEDALDPRLLNSLLEHMACGDPPTNLELPESWYVELAAKQVEKRRYAGAAKSLRKVAQDSERHRLFERLIHVALDAKEIQLLAAMPELEQLPESPWKLLARHRVLSKSGLVDDAAVVEQQFLERYPDHPRRYGMLISMSRREIRSGRPEKGLGLARQAASLRPSSNDPLVEQAFALVALGRADEAERMLEIVLASSPSHAGALQLLERMDHRRDGDVSASAGGTARLRLSIDTRGGE